MPLNTLISKIMLRRIPQIEHFMQHPIEVQHQVFETLISNAKNTIWGQYYDYKSIKDEYTFNQRIPLCTYDDLLPFFTRSLKGESNVLWHSDIKWFSKSSGTTNTKSKFIPVSKESLEECHYKGGKDMLALYCNNHPDSSIFTGLSLALGGSKQENIYNNNIFCGDVSAIIIDNLPLWAELFRIPKKEIALYPEWERKLEMMVDSVSQKDVVSLSGVPSWMMVLLNKMIAKTGKTISEIWPNLEVYFHGGVSFAPYRTLYNSLLPSNINYMETYNASEGFFGLQDTTYLDSMLLLLDYGIYYEFIPFEDLDKQNKHIIPLADVETGKNYAMVISTNGGLWRYLIGDTVCFTQKKPYRFIITGRTKNYINICGEELMVDNADKALSVACEVTHSKIRDYTGAPMDLPQGQHCHQWLIEFELQPKDLQYFTEVFDKALQETNSDYEAKRYKDFVLKRPIVQVVKQNTFYNWLKDKGKLGGQHKISRLNNNRDFIEEVLKYQQ